MILMVQDNRIKQTTTKTTNLVYYKYRDHVGYFLIQKTLSIHTFNVIDKGNELVCLQNFLQFFPKFYQLLY